MKGFACSLAVRHVLGSKCPDFFAHLSMSSLDATTTSLLPVLLCTNRSPEQQCSLPPSSDDRHMGVCARYLLLPCWGAKAV